MSDLEQIRDALDRLHCNAEYNGCLNDFRLVKSTLSHMIETPAPQGWKLVPIEPTMEMIWSGIENTEEFVNGDPWYGSDPLSDGQAEQCYKAMLSAAPTPAPTEKVDLGALKREINSLNGRWCKDDGKTTTSDDLIDYLANTGRLLR